MKTLIITKNGGDTSDDMEVEKVSSQNILPAKSLLSESLAASFSSPPTLSTLEAAVPSRR